MTPLLEISEIAVRYGEAQAVRGISLTVASGEIVSVLGANGAGKTTMLNAISGLRRVAAGRILFAGTEITNWPADRVVRLGVRHVPEGRRLFSTLSVEENLRIGAYATRLERGALSETMQRVFTLFPRLRERRRQLAGSLSGGEQQMLALGRALMTEPLLLMLDEPSLGLSPRMTNLILGTVVEVARFGTAVLLVEQNARQALRVSSRAYVLENGRIGLFGPADSLARDPRVQALYLGATANVRDPVIVS